MKPRHRLAPVAVSALLWSGLTATGGLGPAAADPDDFPTISSQPTADPEAEAEQNTPPSPGDEGESSNGLASARDCSVIKQLVSHADVLLNRQVSVIPAFPSKEEGIKAIDLDLDVLNNLLPFLVYAEGNLQDEAQRAKIVAYKNDLGQLSLVIAERKGQELESPAPYAWAARLSETGNKAAADYVKIGNSCLT